MMNVSVRFHSQHDGLYAPSSLYNGLLIPLQTHTELLRCLNELIRAKVTHFTKAELKEQDELYLASLPKPKSAPSKPGMLIHIQIPLANIRISTAGA